MKGEYNNMLEYNNIIEYKNPNWIWDSKAEYYTYRFLKQHLNSESYEIYPHIVLRDIFDELDEEFKHLHIDLLITTKLGQPLLGIEVNGNQHQNNKKIKFKDEIKQKLFSSLSIPLIFIPLGEIKKYTNKDDIEEYIQNLENMIQKFLSPFDYHISIPAYCPKCGKIMDFYYNSGYTGKFYSCDTCKKTGSDNVEKPLTVDHSLIPLLFNFNKKLE